MLFLMNAPLKHDDIEIVNEVFNFIAARLHEHYTIRQLSKRFGINERKLKSGFRQVYGFGVFRCLEKLRMELASRLLTETDKPIKEIASIVGYKRTHSFITAFRLLNGITPGKFRKQ